MREGGVSNSAGHSVGRGAGRGRGGGRVAVKGRPHQNVSAASAHAQKQAPSKPPGPPAKPRKVDPRPVSAKQESAERHFDAAPSSSKEWLLEDEQREDQSSPPTRPISPRQQSKSETDEGSTSSNSGTLSRHLSIFGAQLSLYCDCFITRIVFRVIQFVACRRKGRAGHLCGQ
jgi:hypothetical protein